ncbi:MAG: hypothetical protein Q8L66_05280 [Caulobacter sp.]|nr:hypothetical protein [Caulobacter sp.]
MTQTRTVTAFNTATASENRIHADDVASRFGFTGGLVPGVDVFAYMVHAPVALWGRDWLSQGRIRARFGKPVYDGDEATTTAREQPDGSLALSVSARGVECAAGTAWRSDDSKAPATLPEADLPRPEDRAAASPESLPVGRVLGTLKEIYFAEVGVSHLHNTREDPALFDGGAIANPAYLLRRANYVLSQSVRLGPWIHIESDVRLHGLIGDGELLETRGVVAANEEKNGHLIVTLDVTISSRERLVLSARHWAIYEPRQVRGAALS